MFKGQTGAASASPEGHTTTRRRKRLPDVRAPHLDSGACAKDDAEDVRPRGAVRPAAWSGRTQPIDRARRPARGWRGGLKAQGLHRGLVQQRFQGHEPSGAERGLTIEARCKRWCASSAQVRREVVLVLKCVGSDRHGRGVLPIFASPQLVGEKTSLLSYDAQKCGQLPVAGTHMPADVGKLCAGACANRRQWSARVHHGGAVARVHHAHEFGRGMVRRACGGHASPCNLIVASESGCEDGRQD